MIKFYISIIAQGVINCDDDDIKDEENENVKKIKLKIIFDSNKLM